MNKRETDIVLDELKIWQSALKYELLSNEQKRIWICKGAIQAIKGLMQELNIKEDK